MFRVFYVAGAAAWLVSFWLLAVAVTLGIFANMQVALAVGLEIIGTLCIGFGAIVGRMKA